MGYPPNIKGYLVLGIEDQKFHKTKDMVFREDIFSFHEINSKIQQNKILNIFPLQETFHDKIDTQHPEFTTNFKNKNHTQKHKMSTKNPKEIKNASDMIGNNQDDPKITSNTQYELDIDCNTQSDHNTCIT